MAYFLDTSAYAKLYHHEPGSDHLHSLVQNPAVTLIISTLTLVEMESVLAIKVRTGELNPHGQQLARRRLQSDLAQRRIELGPALNSHHYQNARQLLIAHAISLGLRTLDAIQAAVCLELNQTSQITALLASDHRLCRVAEVNGCPALDPAAPNFILP